MNKPTLGVYSFSCCEGCSLDFLNLVQTIDLLEKFDIKSFRLLKEKPKIAKLNIAIVEGAITSKEQIKELKEIRTNTKYLIALGACAVEGGIPSLSNLVEKNIIEKIMHDHPAYKSQVKAAPLSTYVKIDFNLRGCPIDKEETERNLVKLAKGLPLREKTFPVCSECALRENHCLLLEGRYCYGPISYGGCHAICPSNGIRCEACRGIYPDANIPALIEILKRNQSTTHKIRQILNKFNLMSDKLEK